MRGTFDFDKELYPFLPQFIGTDEVVIRHQITGEEFERQPLAGAYGSPERKAQNEKLEAEALRLNRESRKANSVAFHAAEAAKA